MSIESAPTPHYYKYSNAFIVVHTRITAFFYQKGIRTLDPSVTFPTS